MKKDTRQIKLDPMEWRDAMREVDKKPKQAPRSPAKKRASATKRPRSR